MPITIDFNLDLPPGTDIESLTSQLSSSDGIGQLLQEAMPAVASKAIPNPNKPVSTSQRAPSSSSVQVQVSDAVLVTNPSQVVEASSISRGNFEKALEGYDASMPSFQDQLNLKDGKALFDTSGGKMMMVHKQSFLEHPSESITEDMLKPLRDVQDMDDGQILITKTEGGQKVVSMSQVTHDQLVTIKQKVDPLPSVADLAASDGRLLLVNEEQKVIASEWTHNEIRDIKTFIRGGPHEDLMADTQVHLDTLLKGKATITHTDAHNDKIVYATEGGVLPSEVTNTQLEAAFTAETGRLDVLENVVNSDGLEVNRVVCTNADNQLVALGSDHAKTFLEELDTTGPEEKDIMSYTDGRWKDVTINSVVEEGAISTCVTSNLDVSKVVVTSAAGKLGASADIDVTKLGYLKDLTSDIHAQLVKLRTDLGVAGGDRDLPMISNPAYDPNDDESSATRKAEDVLEALGVLNSQIQSMAATTGDATQMPMLSTGPATSTLEAVTWAIEEIGKIVDNLQNTMYMDDGLMIIDNPLYGVSTYDYDGAGGGVPSVDKIGTAVENIATAVMDVQLNIGKRPRTDSVSNTKNTVLPNIHEDTDPNAVRNVIPVNVVSVVNFLMTQIDKLKGIEDVQEISTHLMLEAAPSRVPTVLTTAHRDHIASELARVTEGTVTITDVSFGTGINANKHHVYYTVTVPPGFGGTAFIESLVSNTNNVLNAGDPDTQQITLNFMGGVNDRVFVSAPSDPPTVTTTQTGGGAINIPNADGSFTQTTSLSSAVSTLSTQVSNILSQITPPTTKTVTSEIRIAEDLSDEQIREAEDKIAAQNPGSTVTTTYDPDTGKLDVIVELPQGTQDVATVTSNLSDMTALAAALGDDLTGGIEPESLSAPGENTVTPQLPEIPNPNAGQEGEPETIPATNVIEVVQALSQRVDSILTEITPPRNETITTGITLKENLTQVQLEEFISRTEARLGGTVEIGNYDATTGNMTVSVIVPQSADVDSVKQNMGAAEIESVLPDELVPTGGIVTTTAPEAQTTEQSLPDIINSDGEVVQANNMIEVVQSLSKEVQAIKQKIEPATNQIITGTMTIPELAAGNLSLSDYKAKMREITGVDVEITSVEDGNVTYSVPVSSSATPGQVQDLQNVLSDQTALADALDTTVDTVGAVDSTPQTPELPQIADPDKEKMTTTLTFDDIDFDSWTTADTEALKQAYIQQLQASGVSVADGDVEVTIEEGSVIASIDVIIPTGSDAAVKDSLQAAISDTATILTNVESDKIRNAAPPVVTAPVIKQATKAAGSVLDVVRENTTMITTIASEIASKATLQDLTEAVNGKADVIIPPPQTLTEYSLNGDWTSSSGLHDVAWQNGSTDPALYIDGRDNRKAWVGGSGYSTVANEAPWQEFDLEMSWSCWIKFLLPEPQGAEPHNFILDFQHGGGNNDTVTPTIPQSDKMHTGILDNWDTAANVFSHHHSSPLRDPAGNTYITISEDDIVSEEWRKHTMTLRHPGHPGEGGQIKYWIDGVLILDAVGKSWLGNKITPLRHIIKQPNIIAIQDLRIYNEVLSDEYIVSGVSGNLTEWKYSLGIDNVDNTSDLQKVTSGPISEALNAKAEWKFWNSLDDATYTHGMFTHEHSTGTPYFGHNDQWVQIAKQDDLTTVVNAVAGLNNVENYSRAEMAADGPIKDELDGKANTGDIPTVTSLGLDKVENFTRAEMAADGPIKDELDKKPDITTEALNTALTGKATTEALNNALTEKANLDSPSFTGTVAGVKFASAQDVSEITLSDSVIASESITEEESGRTLLSHKAVVDTVTTLAVIKPEAPNPGDVLKYDEDNGWIAAAPSSGGGGGGGAGATPGSLIMNEWVNVLTYDVMYWGGSNMYSEACKENHIAWPLTQQDKIQWGNGDYRRQAGTYLSLLSESSHFPYSASPVFYPMSCVNNSAILSYWNTHHSNTSNALYYDRMWMAIKFGVRTGNAPMGGDGLNVKIDLCTGTTEIFTIEIGDGVHVNGKGIDSTRYSNYNPSAGSGQNNRIGRLGGFQYLWLKWKFSSNWYVEGMALGYNMNKVIESENGHFLCTGDNQTTIHSNSNFKVVSTAQLVEWLYSNDKQYKVTYNQSNLGDSAAGVFIDGMVCHGYKNS